MVTVGNDAEDPVLCFPDLALPFPTKILAHGAKLDGAFGLVGPPFTNAYQLSDLGLNRPGIAFTNHYHRTGGEGGLGVDLGE